MRLLTLISGLTAIVISGSLMALGAGNIAATKHNLSSTSAAAIKATDGQTQICVFCHTPHNSNPIAPLWNKSSNGNTYIPYDSSTFSIATPGQPTGSSLLCLSCHDGTLALGEIYNDTDVTMTDLTMPAGVTNLGEGTNDLSNDHPVSFDYATAAGLNSELKTVAAVNSDPDVHLDGSGLVQCTSCHDPHTDAVPKFLVKSNTASALCITCHTKAYWDDTNVSHRVSTATWNSVAPDPWFHTEETTVANNACENCHSPHTAGNPERILNYAAEEQICLACHNSNVATLDIEAEFAKASTHPIYTYSGTGDHDAAEDDGIDDNVVDNRHVVCFDCHNPHGVQAIGTVAGKSGPLNGAKGVDIDGADIEPVDYPHQVCFRCHGDSTGKPAQLTLRRLDADRDPTNVRLEFNPASSASYHPVSSAIGGPLATDRVPSLIAGVPLALGGTTGATGSGTTISCLDCHNNDQNPRNGAAGTGPNGPHGSAWPPILERQYEKADRVAYVASDYAMCYKCHDEAVITGNDGNWAVNTFMRHNFHITGAGAAFGVGLNTPCNLCHDPHGSVRFDRLINYDTTNPVEPVASPTGAFADKFYFATDGDNTQCTLSCHGQDHPPCGYQRSTGTICGQCMGMGGGACTALPPP
ncbi:MAG: hypothetical protein OQK69_02555 [Gammaproteobacteria bacterium]|nr:hypothetical protein [Gammaproteobacteria bacterium]